MQVKSICKLMLLLSVVTTHASAAKTHNVFSGGNRLNLTGANLSNLNTKQQNLRNSQFVRANLTEAEIDNSDLSYSDLTRAVLYKANLFHSNLSNVNFSGAILIKAKCNCTNVKGANFYKANLTDADFSAKTSFCDQVTLLCNWENPFTLSKQPNAKNRINANFKSVTAINTNFKNTNLIASNFEDADLSGAKFNYAVLSFANFNSVRSLEGTDFRGAVLFGADFTNANVRYAIVSGVDFYGVRGLTETQKKILVKRGAINVYTQQELDELENTATLVQNVMRTNLKKKKFEKMKQKAVTPQDDVIVID